MLSYKILRQVERKWGTELTIDVLDDKGERVIIVTRTFNPLPISESRLDRRIREMLVKLEAKLAEPEPAPKILMTPEDAEAILREKGYLVGDTPLEDLPSVTEYMEAVISLKDAEVERG